MMVLTMAGKPGNTNARKHGVYSGTHVNLHRFTGLDKRSRPYLMASEIMQALGGEETLSPQRRKLVDLLTRATLLLDSADQWLFSQQSIVQEDSRSLLPAIRERQSIADHVVKLLDKLGLERVVKPIDLASYYADAKPVDAQPDEPVVNVEAARQPDVDADESDVEAEADADDADGDADDLDPEPVVSEVVSQPVRRTHASPAKPVDLIDFDPSVGKEPA